MNNILNDLIYSYSFYYIAKESEIIENQILLDNLKYSKVAIIKEFTEINLDNKETYSIVSFKKTIIIIFQQSSNLNLDKLL